MKYIVYNDDDHRSEGVVLSTEANAFSAVDGVPRPDPDLGGIRSQSTLGEAFFETYGEEAEPSLKVFPFADLINDIQQFHTKFGLHAATVATVMPPNLAEFRIKFMDEELTEYVDSGVEIERILGEQYGASNPVLSDEQQLQIADHLHDQLDALVDLAYVVIGTAYLQFGPSRFAEAWSRVHAANMAKERAERKDQSKRESTYDVVKPEGWQAPNHSDLVRDFQIRTEDIE